MEGNQGVRALVRRALRIIARFGPTRAALRSLSRAGLVPEPVWTRLPLEGTFTVELGQGGSFLYRSSVGDATGRGLYWRGLSGYEPTTIPAFCDLARKSLFVVDVGAHTGLYTLLACAANPSAHVIAVEAAPQIAARLSENIEINRWHDRCEVRAEAVSNYSGRCSFHVPCSPYDNVTTMGSMNPEGFRGFPGTLVDVSVATLDEICEGRGTVDLIKIDVEGFCHRALDGARRVLSESRPALIIEVLEIDDHDAIRSILTEFGYEFFDVREGGPFRIDKLGPGDHRHSANVLCMVPQRS